MIRLWILVWKIKIKVGIFSNKVTAVEMKNNFSFLFLRLDFIKI